MDKIELETQVASASTLVSVADELERKLEENSTVISERRVGSTAAVNVTRDILSLMRRLQARITDSNVTTEARLAQADEVVRSLIGWLEAFPHNERDDITRMEATQEGMRRALQSVRDTGQARLAALREIETLAKSPPSTARKPGQRPVKISAAQHAKELRSSIDVETKQASVES